MWEDAEIIDGLSAPFFMDAIKRQALVTGNMKPVKLSCGSTRPTFVDMQDRTFGKGLRDSHFKRFKIP